MERKRLIQGRSREVHRWTKRFYRITETGKTRLQYYMECNAEVINFMKLLLKEKTKQIPLDSFAREICETATKYLNELS